MELKVNFAFIRHGLGCHNVRALFSKSNYLVPIKDENEKDPVLSEMGVESSIGNGCIISKVLATLPEDLAMEKINVVGCSPLIRSMETAYYMSRKWKYPPTKIYVFPFLREIDEHAIDKNSPESFIKMDSIPEYAMKTIPEQKAYLQSIGILDYFDFSFVEKYTLERHLPGDIPKFIDWFGQYCIQTTGVHLKRSYLNVFIITHAGVLRDYTAEKFTNNSGFVINTLYKLNGNFELKQYISLKPFLKNTLFVDNYQMYNKHYYCPSNRCDNLCRFIPSKKRLSVVVPCEKNN